MGARLDYGSARGAVQRAVGADEKSGHRPLGTHKTETSLRWTTRLRFVLDRDLIHPLCMHMYMPVQKGGERRTFPLTTISPRGVSTKPAMWPGLFLRISAAEADSCTRPGSDVVSIRAAVLT